MRAANSAVAVVLVLGAVGAGASGTQAEAAQQRSALSQSSNARPSNNTARGVGVIARTLPARIAVSRVRFSFVTADSSTPRLSRSVARRAGSAVRQVAFLGTAAAAGTWGGGISCVPYARAVSGIQVSGNGGAWWHNAAGLYQRGQRPETGSVLAFASSGGMHSGHVAVVERAVGPREIRIQHANWEGPGIRKGTVMHDVAVVDVSDRNDWTLVRVQVGRSDASYGRAYPTYGFIHNRAENGHIENGAPVLRASAPRYTEIAEAPMTVRTRGTLRPLDLTLPQGVPAAAPVPALR